MQFLKIPTVSAQDGASGIALCRRQRKTSLRRLISGLLTNPFSKTFRWHYHWNTTKYWQENPNILQSTSKFWFFHFIFTYFTQFSICSYFQEIFIRFEEFNVFKLAVFNSHCQAATCVRYSYLCCRFRLLISRYNIRRVIFFAWE